MNSIIWVPDHKEIDIAAIELLSRSGYQIIYSVDGYRPSQVVGIFVRTYTIVDSKCLESFPNLKFILKAGVGTDNIDMTTVHKKGIKLFNAPGSNSLTVAEYVASTMIWASHNIEAQRKSLNSKKWRSFQDAGSDISGKTLGLIGFGSIGKEIARVTAGFNLEIIAYDPYLMPSDITDRNIKLVELTTLLSQSDVISIQVPLTNDTNNLINHEAISLMKPGVILINVSRGALIDDDAIRPAIERGTIGYLVMDVYKNEPNIDERLLVLPNTILTPHIAGLSKESNKRMSLIPVQNFLAATKD